MLLWPNLARQRGGNPVGVTEAVNIVNRQQGVFLDVRSAEQYKAGTIAQARHIPAAELAARLDSLPKNKPLIVIGDQGRDAKSAVAALRKHGLEAVSLEGGLRSWQDAGLPVSKKS